MIRPLRLRLIGHKLSTKKEIIAIREPAETTNQPINNYKCFSQRRSVLSYLCRYVAQCQYFIDGKSIFTPYAMIICFVKSAYNTRLVARDTHNRYTYCPHKSYSSDLCVIPKTCHYCENAENASLIYVSKCRIPSFPRQTCFYKTKRVEIRTMALYIEVSGFYEGDGKTDNTPDMICYRNHVVI